MNIIERSRTFVEELRARAKRSVWDWRRCSWCGSRWTIKNGGYWRHPWTKTGRVCVRIQRHRCFVCRRSYAEERAWLVRRSWYARGVHRYAVDWWMHGRSSLRRVAEMLRSEMGRQERWRAWEVWEESIVGSEVCRFAASTLQRWLDKAGEKAQESVPGQLEGVGTSGQMGSDGLWVRLRGQAKGVVLSLVDSVTGVVWAVVVAAEEESTQGWERLFERAKVVGLAWDKMNGLTSDGAQGLLSYLRRALPGVHQQRCIWHFWRSLAADLARAVAQGVKGLAQEVAKSTAQTVRRELCTLLHGVIDASTSEEAEQKLAQLAAHTWGQALAAKVNEHLDRLLFYLLDCHRGLVRIGPEWFWRDFRARLSRGRNHGSTERLERAALVWAIYRNFTPAQERKERSRHYKHPGQSPLEVAASALGGVTYLDALQI